ncbi:esterase [Streptomyces sp. NPDC014735]|uniref:esterase n=1 Tax=unclassified Streptomyces TaxID=2593676 RepID=UPI0036F8B864
MTSPARSHPGTGHSAASGPQTPARPYPPALEPASRAGWDVAAHLGLATTEALLASWPAAPDDWPRLVRPTLHEVTGLCAALAVATVALDLSNRLAEA